MCDMHRARGWRIAWHVPGVGVGAIMDDKRRAHGCVGLRADIWHGMHHVVGGSWWGSTLRRVVDGFRQREATKDSGGLLLRVCSERPHTSETLGGKLSRRKRGDQVLLSGLTITVLGLKFDQLRTWIAVS